MSVALVPICGRCGTDRVNHDAYEATYGYGGCATGCQNCNPAIRSDRERRVAALKVLEAEAARVKALAAEIERDATARREAVREERLQHAPMRELSHQELVEAHARGFVSEAMFRAERQRRSR